MTKTTAKLTWEDVCRIRKEYSESRITQVALAKKWKVSQVYIHQIIYNKTRNSDKNSIIIPKLSDEEPIFSKDKKQNLLRTIQSLKNIKGSDKQIVIFLNEQGLYMVDDKKWTEKNLYKFISENEGV